MPPNKPSISFKSGLLPLNYDVVQNVNLTVNITNQLINYTSFYIVYSQMNINTYYNFEISNSTAILYQVT